jgi:cyclophilin family peptidyl-prolyl cis-trans isomerase
MRSLKLVLFIAIALTGALFAGEKSRDGSKLDLPDGLYAEFTTAHGTVTAQLFADKVPMTVTNFVGLTEGTLGPKKEKPYYTGLKWYRVVPGFVIQSGNPDQPEEGDAGYTFPDEFVPGLRHDEAGILSMANGGPDTNSSEFFITLGNQTRLNYLHSVFGKVVRGVELLPQIKQGEAFSIRILRIGKTAEAFKADSAAFKGLSALARPYKGESDPGPAAHFYDPDSLLPTEPPRAQYFNYKLNNFERATGVKIVARVFAKAPPEDEDKVPGAYMRALAEKAGVAKRGAFVAYFADDDWRVWIGDDLTSAFLGRTASASDLIAEGALHKVKETLLDAAHAAGDAAFLAQQKAAPPDKQPAANQRLKLQTDALLDGLIFKLEPR